MLLSKEGLITSNTKTIRFRQSKASFIISNELMEQYEVMEKIGRGKYSDVFKCMNSKTDTPAVLKFLKPVRDSKIRR